MTLRRISPRGPTTCAEWQAGLVPWPLHEYCEYSEALVERMSTPKDDWCVDRNDLDFVEEGLDGIRLDDLSPYDPEVQKLRLLSLRYSDRPDLLAAHYLRFTRMEEFIDDHWFSLEALGYVKEEDGFAHYREDLVEALCTLPFSQVTMECFASGQEIVRRFSFTEVIQQVEGERAGERTRDGIRGVDRLADC